MLRCIPRQPRKIDASSIQGRLDEQGLNVSLRTIQRDLVELSRIFPLLSDDRTKPFGWSWQRNADIYDLPGMDPNTALTFVLSNQFLGQHLPPSIYRNLQPHFNRAKHLLDEISHSNKLRKWPNKIRTTTRMQPLKPPNISAQVIDIVYGALLNEHKFTAEYHRKGERNYQSYDINPLGLVFTDSVTYLVCTLWEYKESKDIIHLALHRMRNVCLLDAKRIMPKRFNLDDYIKDKHFSYPVTSKLINLKARFTKQAAEHLYETQLTPNQTLKKDKDDHLLLSAKIAYTHQLRWWLLGFGDQVEVISPKSLRNEFSMISKRLSRMYS